jgi:uncharacterized membrane protein
MPRLLVSMAFLSIMLGAAIFGFFYAWVCSTMWGLDQADPRVAIAAMQAMNASVRNPVFAPAFFATPFALLVTAVLAWSCERRTAAAWFAAAGGLCLFGGLILTVLVNVPMNEALAAIVVPADPGAAEEIWNTYSSRWQFFNQIRAIALGLSLLLATFGLYRTGAMHSARHQAAETA